MKLFVTFLALTAARATHVYATPDGAKIDEDQSQSAQNARAYDEFKRVDAELTEVFEHRLRELEKSPALREALSSSQRAWLAFREAEGHLESIEDEGGTARTYYVNKRMTFLTRQRIYQLKTPFAQGWAEPSKPASQ